MGEFEFVVSRGLDQGAALPFPGKRFVVGSGAQCGLRITDPGVAPRHLEIWLSQDGTARVRDLAGRGDVFIDGVALSG